MAKVTLNSITSGYGSADALNTNFDRIQDGLDNTLSLDGTSPNEMLSSLDMGDNKIVNLASPTESNDAVRLVDLQDAAVATDFPSQAGNAGKFLKTDGTVASWSTVDPGIIALTASDVANVPSGSIAAVNVQTALNELDTEKAALASPTFTGTPSLPTGSTGVTQSPGDSSTKLATTAFVATVLPSGAIIEYGGSTAPTGWLECDGSTVSRATYANLFAALSSGSIWGTGDGSSTFHLPDYRGKVRVGRGAGTIVASGTDSDVDLGADTFIVPSNIDKWTTGMPVVFSLSSGTITGLTSGNTYYVIRAGTTVIQLASTVANAQNGTRVDFTAKSSPVWTITYSLTSRTLAAVGGEETHAASTTETPPHNHSQNAHGHSFSISHNRVLGVNVPGTNTGDDQNTMNAGTGADSTSVADAYSITNGTATNIASAGGVAMNNMQPYVVGMVIIKT